MLPELEHRRQNRSSVYMTILCVKCRTCITHQENNSMISVELQIDHDTAQDGMRNYMLLINYRR